MRFAAYRIDAYDHVYIRQPQYIVRIKRGRRVTWMKCSLTVRGVVITLDDAMASMVHGADAVRGKTYDEWRAARGSAPDTSYSKAYYADHIDRARKLAWLFPDGVPEDKLTKWREW